MIWKMLQNAGRDRRDENPLWPPVRQRTGCKAKSRCLRRRPSGMSQMVPSSQRFPAMRGRSLQVDRPDVVLAGHGRRRQGRGGTTAVQVENLLLLIDREAADEIGGPFLCIRGRPSTGRSMWRSWRPSRGWRLRAAPSSMRQARTGYASRARRATTGERCILAGMPAPGAALSAEGRPMDPDRAVLVDDGGDLPPVSRDGSHQPDPAIRIARSGPHEDALLRGGHGQLSWDLLAAFAGPVRGQNAVVIESDWWAVGDDIRYALDQANAARG